MGQKSTTETLFRIIAAFIDHRTWKQADLARHLGTRSETVRRHLVELGRAGLKLEQEKEHPHVYWSVPKGWLPGALAFKAEEARDLLRLIGRAPSGALRNRVIGIAVARLGQSSDFDPSTLQPADTTPDEERWLPIVEDAAAQKVALKMRYFSASRGKESWRHVSVHRVDHGARPHIVATCHRAGELRRFRVDNVLDARLDKSEPFRPTTPAAIAKLDRESFGGYRDVGPVVRCVFHVRDPEAAWVAKNLPDANITSEPAPNGTCFTVETSSIAVLARFVAGLGEVARPQTPELASEIRTIARAALANAS